MSEEVRKRRGVHMGVWVGLAVVGLPVLYMLSFIPIMMSLNHAHLTETPSWLQFYTQPTTWIYEHNKPAREGLDKYGRFLQKL